MARPILCYSSESWTSENRFTAKEMKFMMHPRGYTMWDHRHNENVMKEVQVEPIVNYIEQLD